MTGRREVRALAVAYVLLAFVVAWGAFDVRRTMDRIEAQNCVAAELSVLAEIGILEVFGEQTGVDVELRDSLLDVFGEFNSVIREHCPAVEEVGRGDG